MSSEINITMIKQNNNLLISALKAMRPIHWVKNLSLFAALFLSGTLLEKGQFDKVFWAFLSFCLITSASYLINDIFDAKADRVHPTKKYRPIASRALPVPIAVVQSLVLIFLSLFDKYSLLSFMTL